MHMLNFFIVCMEGSKKMIHFLLSFNNNDDEVRLIVVVSAGCLTHTKLERVGHL